MKEEIRTPTPEEILNKSATQILWENGISIMEMNDEFNCSILKAMEEYKNLCLREAIEEIQNIKYPGADVNYQNIIEILKERIK